MYKSILSLILVLPFFTHALNKNQNWLDLTTSKTRNLCISLNEKFTITALVGPQHKAIPWRVIAYEPFELLYEGWNDGCIGDNRIPSVMESNTQIWTFKANQIGIYELEFGRPYPSPLQAIEIEKIAVEVY